MTEWLSVNKELPPTDKEVLFTYDGKVCYGCFIWYDPDFRWLENSTHLYRYDVTHWMPLPKPPQHN